MTGKPDLLKKLPKLLAGYAAMRAQGADVRVLVLVDRDEDDCAELKARMERIAPRAGLDTRTRANGGRYCAVTRIAVRELENWYFGDWAAVRATFPKVGGEPPGQYRSDADAARTKTSNEFERCLRTSGIRNPSKPDWAARIGPHLDPARNRSASFQRFLRGVRDLVENGH